MNDLTRDLYEFVTTRRLGMVCDNPEYREILDCVELQEKKVAEGLNEGQRKELKLLLEQIAAQYSIENESIFLAALKLAKELNALVRF